MDKLLISIIIPTLNQGKFIGITLQSIIDQNYPDIEIIVMDGGSTDSTVKTIKDFESKIKRLDKRIQFSWVSKKDKGQSNAINLGWKKAKGDILCYLNSDDYLLPGCLNEVAKVFTDKPDAKWMTGDYIIVDEKGKEIQKPISFYKRVLRYIPLSVILPFTNPIIQPSTFLRKTFVQRIGYFDETLRFTFDYDYWFRCLSVAKPFITDVPLSSFRIHGESKGGRQYKKQFEEEMKVVRRHNKKPFVLASHRMHNKLIVGIYDFIK